MEYVEKEETPELVLLSGEGTITCRFNPRFEIEIFQQKVFRSNYPLHDVRTLLDYLIRCIMRRSENCHYVERLRIEESITFSFGKKLEISAKGMRPETIDIEDTINLAKFIFDNLIK